MDYQVPRHYLLELAESLSAALDVPVEITDLRLNRLARALPETVDPDSPGHVSPRRLGIARATSPTPTSIVRVGGVRDLGMPGFVVVPLEAGEQVRFLMWLTDVGNRLAPARLRYAQQTALATVGALHSRGLLEDEDWQDTALDRALVLGALNETGAAIIEAANAGALRHDERFVALGVQGTPVDHFYSTQDSMGLLLRSMARRVAGLYPAERTLVARVDDVAVVLFAPYVHDDTRTLAERISAFAMDQMFRTYGRGPHDSWLVAVSDTGDGLSEAGQVVWQARQGLALGKRLGWRRRSLHWSTMGHLRGISTLTDHHLRSQFVSPALRAFLDDPSLVELHTTLKSFLDNAGHVQRVAEQTFVHRATVYHRIGRIEKMLGVDLDQGRDRLDVHLGLIAWALSQADRSRRRRVGP